MKVAVIGSGHVGLITGLCFAELGNVCVCVDVDKEKIAKLKKGIAPFYEPGLGALLKKSLKKKKVLFTTDIKEAVERCEIIFIAVGTPPKENGDADLTYVEAVAREIAVSMKSYKLIVEKSTVPVETGSWLKKTINAYNKRNVEFDVASNPEFLREGKAIYDFMCPDRVILGVESPRAEGLLKKLYKPIKTKYVVTDIKSAEIIKHASNSFLSTKISFINQIAQICDKVGADVIKVAEGMGLDKRIGRAFLDAGCGFGGFCFPKDLVAFIRIAEKRGIDFSLLKVVEKINTAMKREVVHKIEQLLWNLSGKTVAVWGLSFKPDTDDMRFAPSIDIIDALLEEKVKIKAYDPQAMDEARQVFGKKIQFCKNPYEAATGAHCLAVITEWGEFKTLNMELVKKKMTLPNIMDARNLFQPERLKQIGFVYRGMGRN